MMTRESKQKIAILNAIRHTSSHPDAGWIYEQVRQEMPRISLGTIYRNLNVLERDGEIRRLEIGMQGRYEVNGDKHCHFRCERCGAIVDVHLSADSELDGKVSKDTGFSVRRHYLEFAGYCQGCE